jgi:hypothetical protein
MEGSERHSNPTGQSHMDIPSTNATEFLNIAESACCVFACCSPHLDGYLGVLLDLFERLKPLSPLAESTIERRKSGSGFGESIPEPATKGRASLDR